MGFNEKRKYPRVPAPVPCQVTLGPLAFTTQTRNISCGGAMCRISHRIPLMTKLEISLQLPDPARKKPAVAIRCMGVVVRQETQRSPSGSPSYLTAIYFAQLAQEDRRRIAEFVLHSMLDHYRRHS